MSELQNKADELGGKVKEASRRRRWQRRPGNQGKGEQAASKVKQGAEDLKDKATETLGKLTDSKALSSRVKINPNRLRF